MRNYPVFSHFLVNCGACLLALAAGPVSADFVAYNDSVGPASGSAANVTHYSGYLGGGGGFETPSGLLKDFDTGLNTSVTATLTAVNVAGSIGGMPNSGTDAHGIFNGIINLNESASYNSSGSNWSYEVSFTGLDPTKAYEFVTTANRNGSSYAGSGSSSRWTEFSISGADTFTNESSAGIVEISPDVLQMNTGYNTVNGYIIQWTNITAADGSFSVLSQNVGLGGPGENIKSYGLQGFRLIETAPIPAPGAALLAAIGLPMLGWAKRRNR